MTFCTYFKLSTDTIKPKNYSGVFSTKLPVFGHILGMETGLLNSSEGETEQKRLKTPITQNINTAVSSLQCILVN